MDIRLWSKELTTDFINLYKSYSCLWRIKSEEYKNRTLRDQAYSQIADFCKCRGFPDANREFVVRKIQSLRGSFRKEYKKYCKSPKKCIPSLWYYDLLLFTKDQELPADSVSDTDESGIAENFVKNDEESFVEQSNSSVVKLEPIRNENVLVPEAKVAQKRDFLGDPVEMCSTTLGTKIEGISEFDAVGINVAKKLAKMDPTQALYAESLISVILRKGLLYQLTEDTNFCKCGCS